MPYYYCSMPNKDTPGAMFELISDDQDEIDRFVETWDRPGRAVYYCPNPLKVGATVRRIETVAAIVCIWVDIDFKDLEEDPEQILNRLLQLPLQPTEVRNSGNGLHLIWVLKEPIDADEGGDVADERLVQIHEDGVLAGSDAAHPVVVGGDGRGGNRVAAARAGWRQAGDIDARASIARILGHRLHRGGGGTDCARSEVVEVVVAVESFKREVHTPLGAST